MGEFDGYSSYEAWKVALHIDNTMDEYLFTKRVIDIALASAEYIDITSAEYATNGIMSCYIGKVFDGVPVTESHVREYVEKEIADRPN